MMMKKQITTYAVTSLLTLFALQGMAEPAAFTDFDVSASPTGQLATLEFSSDADKVYDILRSPNLLSNEWNLVIEDLPGTGNNIIYTDHTPLDSIIRFYRLTATDAPPANLIINGDFETPALETGGTDIDTSGDWIQTGDSQKIQKAEWAAESGEQGAWLQGWTKSLDRSFYQDITGAPGMDYTLDAGFAFDPNFESNGSTLHMYMIWLDGDGIEINRLTLDVNANLDTADGWKHLSLNGISPAGTATVRIQFHFTTDSEIETSQQSSAMVDNVTLFTAPAGATVESTNWTALVNATHVAAAQYAGLYAVADSTSIEVTDINQNNIGTVALSSINGMAFTSSGRQLFIATPTEIKSFNSGTGGVRTFISGLSLGSEKTGLAHFKGELFVGTAAGSILRYDAAIGDLSGSHTDNITIGAAVRSIAVDIQDEMLYVATPDKLYRLDPATSDLSEIAALPGIESISYGRTYGATDQGGLAVLQNTGADRIIHLVTTADLQAGGAVSPTPYYTTRNPVPDISMTACGRMLAAGPTPVILSDTTDSRMNFMEWVADEYHQNVLFAKTLCWQDGGLTGMVQNTVTKWNKNRGSVASPDAAYWVVNQLLMNHHITGDLEAQPMVREIVKRYATLHTNPDGQWYHWYDSRTGDRTWGDADPDATTSAYSTMKAVHMAIRAKNYFWYDTEIVEAADSLIGALRNQRDYVRAFGTIASPADDMGPVLGGHRPAPYQELHLYGELMAATDPMCENAYLDYWRYRDNHPYDLTMPDEPIIQAKTAGFWRMYDQATVGFCHDDPEWQEEFKNFEALHAGWTDDNAPEHLTAFSAGQIPSYTNGQGKVTTYSSDKYTSHPWTVNSFGTVIGFGLHGNTVPVVGAYFAYRDGRRQLMEGSDNYADPHLLTRISYEQPSWVMGNLSPTDHQYAGYALGELLKPGSIAATISAHTYIEPHWFTKSNGDKTIEFSRLIKRQVWGTTDGSSWESLGYHHAPYTVPAASPWIDFNVTGAEGELLKPETADAAKETFDVTDDVDGTLYIVRAVTTNTVPLRARWFNGETFLSEQTGSKIVNAYKPADATVLKVDLSGESFDQISVVLDGKPELFSNHGFEDGNLNGWSGGASSSMSRSNIADSRLEGSRAGLITASVSAANGNSASFWCDYDISGDPVGTHYVFEQDVLTENLQGSSIRIHVEIKDAAHDEIGREYFDTFEKADTQTVLSAGMRKRTSEFHTLRYLIQLQRDDASVVTTEERVLIDTLRLLKMKP